jgi:RHS repeat-associated protein
VLHSTRYYHTDVIGSVRAITDEVGAVVTRHDYRPFGENTNPLTGDPRRFAGKELDPETAMQYFDARYYRNTWGRFTSVDPVMGSIRSPQTLNRYAYAVNNPLRFADPTGHSERGPATFATTA